MRSNKIAFIIDPIEKLNPKKDSSLAMMEEALNRGWQVYIAQAKDLSVINGQPFANVKKTKVDFFKSPWHEVSESEESNLSEFAVIVMRKDPPVDAQYLHCTYVLDLAEQAGVLVLNKPQSLRDANEKFFLSHFSHCATDTLFSMDPVALKSFIQQHQHVVVKPLDSMGGKSIFIAKAGDPNVNVILETVTKNFSEMIVVQKYIPEITQGDKRILVINGKPIPFALARIPAQGEHRGNLAAGGIGKVIALNERDHWICQQVAPTLVQKGLQFVGLDVIGNYLTEVNVTSATCIREIASVSKINIAGEFFNYIEETVR